MVVDLQFVRRLLGEIEEHVSLLEAERANGKDGFLRDRVRRYGVQYALQASVEAALAVAHHVIAETGAGAPQRVVDTARALAEARILEDPQLVERFSRMIRFRNLLVHRYWQVDPELVWQILEEDLEDFRQFSGAIARFLSWTS